MKKYTFKFTGRQSGAIGIFYKISDTYKCSNIHEAFSYLYADYEHIQGLTIYENSKVIDQPGVIKWVNVRPHTERKRAADKGTYIYTRSDSTV